MAMLFAQGNLDWSTMAAAWGPAIPIFAVLVYYLHQLVFGILRPGIRRMRRAISKEALNAQQRHEEAMNLLKHIGKRLDEAPFCVSSNTARKKSSDARLKAKPK